MYRIYLIQLTTSLLSPVIFLTPSNVFVANFSVPLIGYKANPSNPYPIPLTNPDTPYRSSPSIGFYTTPLTPFQTSIPNA